MSTEEETNNKTDEGEDAGDAVIEDGDLDAHAGVEEQGKVPDLVGQLVTEDGDAGGEASGETHREGGADCESVSKVVDGVTDNDHEGGRGHLAARIPGQTLIAGVPLIEAVAVQTAHTLGLKLNSISNIVISSSQLPNL